MCVYIYIYTYTCTHHTVQPRGNAPAGPEHRAPQA